MMACNNTDIHNPHVTKGLGGRGCCPQEESPHRRVMNVIIVACHPLRFCFFVSILFGQPYITLTKMFLHFIVIAHLRYLHIFELHSFLVCS